MAKQSLLLDLAETHSEGSSCPVEVHRFDYPVTDHVHYCVWVWHPGQEDERGNVFLAVYAPKYTGAWAEDYTRLGRPVPWRWFGYEITLTMPTARAKWLAAHLAGTERDPVYTILVTEYHQAKARIWLDHKRDIAYVALKGGG
jgi:hypothetical protein